MASKYLICTLLGSQEQFPLEHFAIWNQSSGCSHPPAHHPQTSPKNPKVRNPLDTLYRPQWTSAIKCKTTHPYRAQSSLYEPQDLNWSQGRVLHLSHELSQARRSLSDLHTTTCCSGELLFQLLMPQTCGHHCQDLGQAFQSQSQTGLTEKSSGNYLSPIYIKDITSQIVLQEQAL